MRACTLIRLTRAPRRTRAAAQSAVPAHELAAIAAGGLGGADGGGDADESAGYGARGAVLAHAWCDAPLPLPCFGALCTSPRLLCRSPDGHIFASNAAGEVAKYAVGTGALVATWTPARGAVVTALVASRDSLVAGCADGVVRWLKYGDGAVTRSVSAARLTVVLFSRFFG